MLGLSSIFLFTILLYFATRPKASLTAVLHELWTRTILQFLRPIIQDFKCLCRPVPLPCSWHETKGCLNIIILYWLPRKAFGKNLSLSPAQGWNAVIETNLTGTYLMSREGLLEQCGSSLHLVFLQHTSSTCLNMEAWLLTSLLICSEASPWWLTQVSERIKKAQGWKGGKDLPNRGA